MIKFLNKVLFKLYRICLEKKGAYKSFNAFFECEDAWGFKYTKLKGVMQLGYKPNLKNPVSFNEKSIHRRLFNRSNLWPVVTNKIAVRDWLVKEKLDQEVKLIPMLHAIEDVEGFDFRNIDEPVVIKAAWASGMNIFIKKPQEENWEAIKDQLLRWKKQEYAPERLIWPATQMKRDFIVERMYSTPTSNLLEDYKFYVFHGQVGLIQVITARDEEPCYAHFDRDFNRLSVKRYNKKEISNDYKLSPVVFEMVLAAEKIGHYFDFARIDFYELDGEVYFGEITQCPNNGYARFEPQEFDIQLGRKWNYSC